MNGGGNVPFLEGACITVYNFEEKLINYKIPLDASGAFEVTLAEPVTKTEYVNKNIVVQSLLGDLYIKTPKMTAPWLLLSGASIAIYSDGDITLSTDAAGATAQILTLGDVEI